MPDMWMDVDVELAKVPVNIVPLVDDTTFKAVSGSVVYNSAGLTLRWNFVTTGGSFVQTAVTPSNSGNYLWSNLGLGMYAIQIPASGGASINNDTEGFGWFSCSGSGLLPWRSPVVGFRAAAVNNDLIDAGEALAKAGVVSALPTASDNADAVWDEATSDHQTAGTTGKALSDAGAAGDPWAAAVRTLTTPAPSVNALSGSAINAVRGDTFSTSITGLGSLANRSALYFTVKESVNQSDDDAILQVEETAGLLRLNGAAATAVSGSLVVDDESAGNITITVAAAETAQIVPATYQYDVQIVRSTGTPVSTLGIGQWKLISDVTRGTS